MSKTNRYQVDVEINYSNRKQKTWQRSVVADELHKIIGRYVCRWGTPVELSDDGVKWLQFCFTEDGKLCDANVLFRKEESEVKDPPKTEVKKEVSFPLVEVVEPPKPLIINPHIEKMFAEGLLTKVS